MKSIKLRKLAGIIATPLLALPIISASCLERVNLILVGKREGEKDKENPEPSTPANPTETPKPPTESTDPKPNEDKSPKTNALEVINNFTDIYTEKAMLDNNPKVFNETGTFISFIPETKAYQKLPDKHSFIFKHSTAMMYYSGIKKYYDYILQADSIKENLNNRLKKLFDPKSEAFINTSYETMRLGIKWRDSLTYNLDDIIEVFEDFYAQKTVYATMYHGLWPLDFNKTESEIKDAVSADDADWNNSYPYLTRESINPKISYSDMYKVSKNFYERLDRHFIQERVKFDKNDKTKKLLALNPVANKAVTDPEYVNHWYNQQFSFDKYVSSNYSISEMYIGTFPPHFQSSSEKRWTPQDFYNNFIILAPFKPIQNSNITSSSLKVLKYYLHFKLVLSMLSKNDDKPFLEQLDDPNNTKLQEFYKANQYENGFSDLLNMLNRSIKKILDPTIYLNYIDESGNKHYFYDEWTESQRLGRTNHIQASNQRQFYTFALNLYNKFIMPLNYVINQEESFEFDEAPANTNLTPKKVWNFKKAFYKEFYEPVFGKIEKLEQNASDQAKMISAKTKLKNFLQNSIVKINGNLDKNLLDIYDIRAKDVTSAQFNEYWLNPDKDKVNIDEI